MQNHLSWLEVHQVLIRCHLSLENRRLKRWSYT